MKDLNLTVLSSPYVEDHFFQFKFKDIEVNLTDLGLSVNEDGEDGVIAILTEALIEFIK